MLLRHLPVAAVAASAVAVSLLLPVIAPTSALASTTTASVSGTLSGLDGAPFEGSADVNLLISGFSLAVRAVPTAGGSPVSSAVKADGSFSIAGIPAGDYRLLFDVFTGLGPWLDTYYGGTPSLALATIVSLAPGDSLQIEESLLQEGSFAITVRGPEGEILPTFDHHTFAFRPEGGVDQLGAPWPVRHYNRTTGVLTYSRLWPGDYRIGSLPPSSYEVVFWPGVATLDEASRIVIGSGDHLSDLEMVVPYKPRISGTIMITGLEQPIPAAGASVALRSGGTFVRSVRADDNGRFVLTGFPYGEYTVCVQESSTPIDAQGFYSGCYGATAENPAGTPVTVQWGTQVDLPDVEVVAGARIVGHLRYTFPPFVATANASEGSVVFWKKDPETGRWDIDHSLGFRTTGDFRSLILEPGEYRLEFRPRLRFEGQWVHLRGFWRDARYFADATSVHVEETETVVLPSTTLEGGTIDVYRVAGDNRYSTSVAIAEAMDLTPPVPVVYIVNGAGYADALSAGPAASAGGGLMLLVEKNSVPAEIARSLRELAPERIVIVGGTGVISSKVERALRAFTPAPSDVVRIAGANRYETSRLLVLDAFGDDAPLPALFLATGRNFPDALAAGPAASHLGGAVMLVDGAASSIDSPTRAALSALDPDNIYLTGMTGSISAGIESRLQSLPQAPNVFRLGGPDRYSTSREIATVFRSDYSWAFLATGVGFADALAGGPLAASYDAPLLLSQPKCIPESAIDSILASGTNALVLVGGTSVLSRAVENVTVC